MKDKSNKSNREMIIVTYIVLVLFLFMIGYISKNLVGNTSDILNNNKNRRQDLLAEQVTKGSILSNDGKILAKTEVDDKGEEKRVYPYGDLFAHAVGRTKNGKTGVELLESYPMLTSSINPIQGMLNNIQGMKNPGNHVVTTLDVELQTIASDGLGNRKGAVVVMNPQTGEIYVMVSKPTYDPNRIIADWNRLLQDKEEESALYNRTTQGLYPPGSTFKLVTVLEYIRQQEKAEKFRYQCTGSIGKGNDKIRCYRGRVHGNVTLESAFAHSCNTAFAEIGTKLDIMNWEGLCKSLFFGKKIPFSLEQRTSNFALGGEEPEAVVRQTAIGQGDTLVTPMQNLFLVAASCNGGNVMQPYLVERVESEGGEVIRETAPQILATPISKKEAKKLTQFMEATVSYGTATALRSENYKAGGKTGSAEFKLNSRESHAWFIGFAQKNKKKLVVSIIVEGAGTGSEVAVPIARRIFDSYFAI